MFDEEKKKKERSKLPANFDHFQFMEIDRRINNIFKECAVYKIHLQPDILDYYLPDHLPAYPANHSRNTVRRMYFFSKLWAPFTRTALDDYIDQLRNTVSLTYFLKQVALDKHARIRYNFVIMDDYAIFIRVPHIRDESSHMFCKHITISSRAKYARFAGEIWCDEYENYLVNNNSGTYRPSDRLIERVIQLFQDLAPKCHFHGASFRFS